MRRLKICSEKRKRQTSDITGTRPDMACHMPGFAVRRVKICSEKSKRQTSDIMVTWPDMTVRVHTEVQFREENE